MPGHTTKSQAIYKDSDKSYDVCTETHHNPVGTPIFQTWTPKLLLPDLTAAVMWVGNLIHLSAHQAGPDLEEIDPWTKKTNAFNITCSMCSHCLSVRPPIRAGPDRTGFTHESHFIYVCVCVSLIFDSVCLSVRPSLDRTGLSSCAFVYLSIIHMCTCVFASILSLQIAFSILVCLSVPRPDQTRPLSVPLRRCRPNDASRTEIQPEIIRATQAEPEAKTPEAKPPRSMCSNLCCSSLCIRCSLSTPSCEIRSCEETQTGG
jgi:hypothetical protein